MAPPEQVREDMVRIGTISGGRKYRPTVSRGLCLPPPPHPSPCLPTSHLILVDHTIDNSAFSLSDAY